MANTTTATVQAYIRTAGHPVTPKELRRRFRVGVWGMRYHLQKLHDAGAIKMAEGRRGALTAWVIDNPKVDMTDRRGLHVNSLRNLKTVMGAKVSLPRSMERNRSWVGATELEKCWVSSSVSMDARQGLLSNSPREGAPAENVPEPA